MSYQRFTYETLEHLRDDVNCLGLKIPFAKDLSPLARKVRLGEFQLPNSLVVQPMEGCDGYRDGRPAELTLRRYRRFARGGAGLLWFEATAVVQEGRANPRQLLLNRDTLPAFGELVSVSRWEAAQAMGKEHRPLCILQLTHSGRYSSPDSIRRPIIAFNDPLLDRGSGVTPELKPISDSELEQLMENYAQAAVLAREAGFDGVDIKACHRYLVSELLAAHTRPGKFGGSLENRMRFLLDTVDLVRQRTGPDFIIAVRFNAFDALPWPWGWGVDQRDHRLTQLDEPKELARRLSAKGVALLNVSAGNPYFNPYIGRPYCTPLVGAFPPDEHPLAGFARLLNLAAEIQSAVPDSVVVGTGYSWLRQFFPEVAAAALAAGEIKLAGLGRMAFAYPDFARDILTSGKLSPPLVCTTCSQCSQIMRDGGMSGCVLRDGETYLPIYREGRKDKA